MIFYYKDLTNRAIDLYRQEKVSFEERLEFFVALQEIVDHLKDNMGLISRIDRVSLAAYGLSYSSISSDAKRVIDGLVRVIPGVRDLSRDFGMPKGTTFNLSFIAHPFNKNLLDLLEMGLQVFEKIEYSLENSLEIFKMAVRFEEDSQFWRFDRVDCTFHNLSVEKMRTTRYRFEDFQCFVSYLKVFEGEGDGDFWSVLKEIFPEFYV